MTARKEEGGRRKEEGGRRKSGLSNNLMPAAVLENSIVASGTEMGLAEPYNGM